MQSGAWVERWNDVIATEAELPGVWRRRDGGFRIRGRVVDPKTSKLRGVNRALPDCRRSREAAAELERELASIRAGTDTTEVRLPRFEDWAATVFERKVASGAIVAVSGRDKWQSILELHLIPAFGSVVIDRLTREDIERWKTRELLGEHRHTKGTDKSRRAIESGRYSPATANTVLGILRQVTAEASREFNIRDVAADVANVNTRGHRTYTYEDPNSLKPEDVPRFLAEYRTRYPEHYAFVFLGLTTGLRPSSLRPLRRCGQQGDVKWDDGKLLVRRSHTRGSEVMEATKTGVDQVIDLDPEQLVVLRWHVAQLEADNERRAKRSPLLAQAMGSSELLFPARPTKWSQGGGFQSRSALGDSFSVVGKAIGLPYDVSPRAMRRTFQDLARAARVSDIVTRAISGHATETMQRHYSTVGGDEVRAGLAKVIDIATGRERQAA